MKLKHFSIYFLADDFDAVFFFLKRQCDVKKKLLSEQENRSAQQYRNERNFRMFYANQSKDVLFVRHLFPHFEVNCVYSNEEYNQRKTSARFEFESVLFVVFVV